MLIDMKSLRSREIEMPKDFTLYSSGVVVQVQSSSEDSLDLAFLGGIDFSTGRVLSRLSFLRLHSP